MNYENSFKRLFDLLISGFLLILLLLPASVFAVLVWITGNGPVFFIQTRIGRNAVPFRIIKFRSMKPAEGGSMVSVRGDARVTRLGRFLRKTKIDELPELINVLKGEMSLVGPRPDVPGFADKLTGESREILNLRPGITGAASLKYINEELLLTSVSDPEEYNRNMVYPDKVRIELGYLRNLNFRLDLKILVYTFLRKRPDFFWMNTEFSFQESCENVS